MFCYSLIIKKLLKVLKMEVVAEQKSYPGITYDALYS